MEPKNKIAGSSAEGALMIEREWQAVVASERVSIECYENQVPSFVGPEMERLYGNIFSSLIHFKTYGGAAAKTSTYVVRKDGETITVFLFRRENGRVRVINEGIRVCGDEIRRFANYVFAMYKSVNVISLHAVETRFRRLPFCHQRFHCTEDLVLALPATRQEYLERLGKNTRRNIKRYSERLRRNFPSFRCDFHVRENVNEEQVREIIGFNRARIAGKNKVSTIDELETERIIQLVKTQGLVGVATIDGRICAGAIAYRCGMNYFLYVIAHDPKYDDHWIGMLCCYLTICECIARGGREFHFLWGRYDYKFTLGSVLRNLDHLVIYRSRAQLLRNGGMALRTAWIGYLHDAKFGLLDKARQQDDLASRLIHRVVNSLRRARRSAARAGRK